MEPRRIQHRVVTDDGAELFVLDRGRPAAPVAVLVHGFSLDHTTWAPVTDLLISNGVRVVSADLRGHGLSTLGSDRPTLERFCGDLVAIIDELGLGQVHLVGHSLGAVIALAARTDARLAETLSSVTSISGTERSIQNPVMRAGAWFFSSPVGIAVLQRRIAGRLMIASWFGRKPATKQLDWIRLLSAGCPRDTRTAITEATGDIDLRSGFDVAGPPTLVLYGRYDKATPPGVSRRIAAAIPDAHLEVIGGAGHMVIIEDPHAVGAHLTDWIHQRD